MASAENEICTDDKMLCADHSQLATNTRYYLSSQQNQASGNISSLD